MTSSPCLQYIEKWHQRIYVEGVFSYVVLLVKCLNTKKIKKSRLIYEKTPHAISYIYQMSMSTAYIP